MILLPYFTVDEPTAKLIEGLGRKMVPVETDPQTAYAATRAAHRRDNPREPFVSPEGLALWSEIDRRKREHQEVRAVGLWAV